MTFLKFVACSLLKKCSSHFCVCADVSLMTQICGFRKRGCGANPHTISASKPNESPWKAKPPSILATRSSSVSKGFGNIFSKSSAELRTWLIRARFDGLLLMIAAGNSCCPFQFKKSVSSCWETSWFVSVSLPELLWCWMVSAIALARTILSLSVCLSFSSARTLVAEKEDSLRYNFSNTLFSWSVRSWSWQSSWNFSYERSTRAVTLHRSRSSASSKGK